MPRVCTPIACIHAQRRSSARGTRARCEAAPRLQVPQSGARLGLFPAPPHILSAATAAGDGTHNSVLPGGGSSFILSLAAASGGHQGCASPPPPQNFQKRQVRRELGTHFCACAFRAVRDVMCADGVLNLARGGAKWNAPRVEGCRPRTARELRATCRCAWRCMRWGCMRSRSGAPVPRRGRAYTSPPSPPPCAARAADGDHGDGDGGDDDEGGGAEGAGARVPGSPRA